MTTGGERGRRSALAAGAGAAALLALLAAIPLAGGGGSGSGSAGPAPGAVGGEPAALIGALRREQVRDDALPHGLAEDLKARNDARPGEDPSRSRRLRVPGGPVYAWPTTHSVCFATTGPQGCVPTDVLRERGAAIGASFTSRVPTVRVFALVRDGIETIRFRLEDGSRVTATVSDNAIQVQLAADPIEASWRNVDGRRVTRRDLVQRPDAP